MLTSACRTKLKANIDYMSARLFHLLLTSRILSIYVIGWNRCIHIQDLLNHRLQSLGLSFEEEREEEEGEAEERGKEK